VNPWLGRAPDLFVASVVITLSLSLWKLRGPRAAAAVWAGWAVPGLGHAILGRPGRGAALFALLAGLYGAGLVILSGHPLPLQEEPFFFYSLGQLGSGVTLVAALLAKENPFVRAGLPVSWYDPGQLYVAAAGLLNLVVVMSLYRPRLAEPPSAPAPPPTEAK
jgi:hypothetical protein